MSQQINLLSDKRQAINSGLVAVAVWVVVLIAVGGVWGVNQLRLVSARNAEAAAATELKNAKSVIQLREDRRSALELEIAVTQPRYEAARQLNAMASSLGSPEGFAPYFSTVASIHEEGLWITGLEIALGGKSLRVDGNSLDNEAVMRFSKRMNEAFSSQGLAFSALDMTPLPVVATSATTVGRAPTPGLAVTRFTIR